MKKLNYTYTEAQSVIKEKIHKEGDIKTFCTKHKLNYNTVINCLLSSSETHPVMIKSLLSIVLNGKPITHTKVNMYTVKKE